MTVFALCTADFKTAGRSCVNLDGINECDQGEIDIPEL